MSVLPSRLPDAFVPTRESLRALACYAISPARKAQTGRIGLRATGDGFGTPPFDDGTQIVVRGDRLIVEPGEGIPITTIAAAAAFLGIPLSEDPGVGKDLPPFAPEAALDVDAPASLALGAWYAFAGEVLAGLGDEAATASEAQLWPEHFDLATVVDLGAGAKVNVGFSPGDQSSADPYLYVGPYDTSGLVDRYWNAPFGALVPYRELVAAPSPVTCAKAFIAEGLDLVRRRSPQAP